MGTEYRVVALVICGGNTTSVSKPLAVPSALVALIVTLNVPDIVGFPLISPVAVFICRPVGRFDAL